MNLKIAILVLLIIVVVSLILLNNNSITNSSSNSDTSKCIITVNKKSYDVTQLRNTHSGGDIFECGTDMTSEFNEEHSNRYSLIEPYKI